MDSDFAYRHYSEALDMMGVALSYNCQYEIDNHPWETPLTTVGVPTLAPGDLLHHKFAVIDQETVITGSHNWSQSANYGNDEAVLIVKNPTIAAHYNREFTRIYGRATFGIPPLVQEKIAAQAEECPQIITRKSRDNQEVTTVNINTATIEELVTLPGIGERLAQRIITAREAQKFTSREDLARVSGISSKMVNNWGDRLSW